jgi:hypothetical protein
MGKVDKYHITYKDTAEMKKDIALLFEAIKQTFAKELHSRLLQKTFLNIDVNKFFSDLESTALNQSSR